MPKKQTQNSPDQNEKPRKKMALGRGLEALLPELKSAEGRFENYFQCDIHLIRPNRYQPRQRFSEAELEELSLSIKEKGILQPLLVRKAEGGYELIAGERRLRAAKRAGLNEVPVLITQATDLDLLEISMIENIQREDLNPMEEAEAYHRLIAEFNLTQDRLAQRIGKSRSAVANFLRLRQLPEQIQASITEGVLSMGHARAILGADTSALQMTAWREVLSKGLSVRETEALVHRLKSEKKKTIQPGPDPEAHYFMDLAAALSRQLGTKVSIHRQRKKGKIEIEFYSDGDLNRLITHLKNA